MNNLEELYPFYAGRRVLVTGDNGFKGSWLSLWLHSMGGKVLGVSLDPPSAPFMHEVLKLAELIPHTRLDIRNYAELAEVVAKWQPEVVFHLAAQPLVRPSYEDPLGTLQSNVMGTAHVLEACRHVPSVHAIVIITSDKCYRNNEWVWGYRENDPMGGHDPYSVSKGCAELITTSYIKSFYSHETYGSAHHVAVASARAGNAIGGGDWGKDRLIPDCFRALSGNSCIHIRYPHAVRPWQHVLECLSGYLLLGMRLVQRGPEFGCGWNFAPIDMGDVWPVERVVRQICRLWGDGRYEVDNIPHPHEAHMLCLDCTKANIELGWRPRYQVADALEVTTRWYRQWTNTQDAVAMRAFTLQQIEQYVLSAASANEDWASR